MCKLVTGFFMGFVVGWVLGILSAPQAGKDTLDSIGERAIELRDRAVTTVDHVRGELRPEV